MITNVNKFTSVIAASISMNKSVSAKLKENIVPFTVIMGIDEDKTICPDFKFAQKLHDPEITNDSKDTLFLIDYKATLNIL